MNIWRAALRDEKSELLFLDETVTCRTQANVLVSRTYTAKKLIPVTVKSKK